MGGACSRKRDQQVKEVGLRRGLSSRYSKSGSSKWPGISYPRSNAVLNHERSNCTSLMEICINKICRVCAGAFTFVDIDFHRGRCLF